MSFESLKDCMERLLTSFDFAGIGWWYIDYVNAPDQFVCNPAMERMFQLPSIRVHSVARCCPIAGDYNRQVAEVDRSAAAKIFAAYEAMINGETDRYENTFPFQLPDGQRRFFKSQARVVARQEDGRPALAHGIIVDVTEERLLETRLREQRDALQQVSRTDPLTGLANRRGITTRLSELRRESGQPLVFCMLDLDHFKRFNDAAGHLAGDEALQRLADILSDFFSSERDSLQGRYGGEEFIIAFRAEDEMAARQKMEHLLTRIRNEMPPHPDTDDPHGRTTASIGCVLLPAEDERARSVDLLIQMADRLLYSAKAQGRDRLEMETLH